MSRKPPVDAAHLLRKLRGLEALVAGATTEGERRAASGAQQRIQERLRGLKAAEPPAEYRFVFKDDWSRKLFTALCRRHALQPYRRAGQRSTTVLVQVEPQFVDATLWPEFERLSASLFEHLEAATTHFIHGFVGAEAPRAAKASGRREQPAAQPQAATRLAKRSKKRR